MTREHRRKTFAAAALALAVGLAGCGDSDEREPRGEPTAQLRPPTVPAAADCAQEALRTDTAAGEGAPPAGRHRYTVRGERQTLGSAGGTTALPERAEFEVTEARTIGNLICYRVQRRYTPQLADEATLVVRGGDVYLAKLTSYVAGRALEVNPDPPVKAIDGDDLEWSGTFEGPTRGSYAATNLGRRAVSAGGRRQRAIGIELRVSFTGEVDGTLHSQTWLSIDDFLPLVEETRQDRTLGGDRTRLDYTARLAEG